MKTNTLSALSLEVPYETDKLSSAIQSVHADAQIDPENYVRSAKVDLGGE